MKHLKTIQVPATTKEVIDKITCDLCGGSRLDTNEGQFDFAEATIEFEEGTRFPDCGNSVKTTIDCCNDCWTGKVFPALSALCITQPRTEDKEY